MIREVKIFSLKCHPPPPREKSHASRLENTFCSGLVDKTNWMNVLFTIKYCFSTICRLPCQLHLLLVELSCSAPQDRRRVESTAARPLPQGILPLSQQAAHQPGSLPPVVSTRPTALWSCQTRRQIICKIKQDDRNYFNLVSCSLSWRPWNLVLNLVYTELRRTARIGERKTSKEGSGFPQWFRFGPRLHFSKSVFEGSKQLYILVPPVDHPKQTLSQVPHNTPGIPLQKQGHYNQCKDRTFHVVPFVRRQCCRFPKKMYLTETTAENLSYICTETVSWCGIFTRHSIQ